MNKPVVYILLTLFLVFASYHIWHQLPAHPHVNDIWVINLDKDRDRWDNIVKRTQHIKDIVHRWPATYGKTQKREDMHKDGVGYAMTQGGDRTSKEISNAGVAGCWLSHKRLLNHLASLDVPDSYGHLISEDDVEFPLDFLKPGDRWHELYKHVPLDWDVVYLGITQPVGTKIHPYIYRAAKGHGYWGTHSYMVRHGALKSKILPDMEWMTDAIDEQYKQYFHKWNVYLIDPSIITLNEKLSENSSIQSYKK